MQARMMWNPSVNAIWLLAASSSEAIGRTVLSVGRLPRGRPLDARQVTLDHLVPTVAEPRGDPVDEQLETLALATEVEEVHSEVGGERHAAGVLQTPDLADRPAPSDDRQGALVEVLEGLGGPRLPVPDRLGHVGRLLDRDRRQAGQRPAAGTLEVGDVADHRDLGVAGHRQVRLDLDAPAAVGLRPGGLGKRSGQADGPYPGGPDDRAAGDPLARAAHIDRHSARVDRRGPHAFAHGHAELGQALGGLGRQRLAERRRAHARRHRAGSPANPRGRSARNPPSASPWPRPRARRRSPRRSGRRR